MSGRHLLHDFFRKLREPLTSPRPGSTNDKRSLIFPAKNKIAPQFWLVFVFIPIVSLAETTPQSFLLVKILLQICFLSRRCGVKILNHVSTRESLNCTIYMHKHIVLTYTIFKIHQYFFQYMRSIWMFYFQVAILLIYVSKVLLQKFSHSKY